MKNVTACVTGASGMIGRKIVERLIMDGYGVRVLSRSKTWADPRVEFFSGGLEDEDILQLFLQDAHLLFHCAAELRDESRMWDVNVLGTARLLRLVKASGIQYLCYLSSAGVVGRAKTLWIDETTECRPENLYEQSKWAAEQLVAQGIDGCRVVILRPTNVIDEERPGALGLAMAGSWSSRLQVFLKGGECAHIVHADNVAKAAMHFISRQFTKPLCFFVSCDRDPLNTYAGLWAGYKALEKNRPIDDKVRPVVHVPLLVPHILRILWRGSGSRGDARYSSGKLIAEGFSFPLDVKDTVKRLVSTVGSKQS